MAAGRQKNQTEYNTKAIIGHAVTLSPVVFGSLQHFRGAANDFVTEARSAPRPLPRGGVSRPKRGLGASRPRLSLPVERRALHRPSSGRRAVTRGRNLPGPSIRSGMSDGGVIDWLSTRLIHESGFPRPSRDIRTLEETPSEFGGRLDVEYVPTEVGSDREPTPYRLALSERRKSPPNFRGGFPSSGSAGQWTFVRRAHVTRGDNGIASRFRSRRPPSMP